ncbi:hypothetical protein RJ640_013114 [Escallonia rubra]|uniref:Retrovirus-related Pol polyprotein from transposon TNT 1-94-like beta-barrel domain-containing protein n=1 Tax=Escallonia rubra TaxID=112253 RepID=A0AA88UPG0_9ASTE|nr:hypothetical protein RJ640_013114 [Escallonia rubra]
MAPNTSTKYDFEKFDGSKDFNLWRMKMSVVLIQQGLLKALKENLWLPEMMYVDEKEDMWERAHSTILLMHDGIVRTLIDVRHIPELRKNMISVGTLYSNRCNYQLMLSKNEELIGKDHGVGEKVEQEVRAPDSLHIIPTYEEDGSHSIEENEEPQK